MTVDEVAPLFNKSRNTIYRQVMERRKMEALVAGSYDEKNS